MKRLRLRNLSRVVRTLSLRLPSNRLMVLASAGGLFAVFAWKFAGGESPMGAGRAGLQMGLCIFLSWAVARELDPDSTRSAALALLVGAAISLTGEPNLWAVTALLFAARIGLCSTGASPNLLDVIWLAAIGAASTTVQGGWIAGLALACALLVDWRLSARPALSLTGAFLTAPATVLAAFANDTIAPAFAQPTLWQWAIFFSVLVALAALRTQAPQSVGDIGGLPLAKERLLWARGLTLGAGVVTSAWIGGSAIPGLVGLWAAFLGIATSRAASRWREPDRGGPGKSDGLP